MEDKSPYPEIPDHVWRNLGLKNEIEAEYLNRPKQFKRVRAFGHAASMRFGPGAAKVYWAEHAAALEYLDRLAPSKPPARNDYEDALVAAGFEFTGQSIVEPHQYCGRTVLHGGGSQ